MKFKSPIGMRTIKTVIAVFLCFVIDHFRQGGIPFYAAIAAILCVQKDINSSIKAAKNREIATLIGGAFGMVFLIFEKYVYYTPFPLVRYLALSLLLIPIIQVSVQFHLQSGTYLMCVVFLCVTVTHGNDDSPALFAISRVIDTTIGIAVALAINSLPSKKASSETLEAPKKTD
ncbi:MAG: FUSC family protein [Oscillibacter sp.]|nr:FUSC family protein [Oscillibacter sp.]